MYQIPSRLYGHGTDRLSLGLLHRYLCMYIQYTLSPNPLHEMEATQPHTGQKSRSSSAGCQDTRSLLPCSVCMYPTIPNKLFANDTCPPKPNPNPKRWPSTPETQNLAHSSPASGPRNQQKSRSKEALEEKPHSKKR